MLMSKHFQKILLTVFLLTAFGATAEQNPPIQNIQLGEQLEADANASGDSWVDEWQMGRLSEIHDKLDSAQSYKGDLWLAYTNTSL